MEFAMFWWIIASIILYIVLCQIILSALIALKNIFIERKPLPLRRTCKSEIKAGNCYRCNSDKIVIGQLGDGNTRSNFYPYFNPGHIRWYHEVIFSICPGVDTETEAKCCTDCGLVWTKLKIQWLKYFISHYCKDEFVREIYGDCKEENHDEGVRLLQNRVMETENEAYCINCYSRIFITGRLFLYLKRSTKGGVVRTVSESLFFHPNHLKEYKLMLRRGIRINISSVCCPVCGYVFTNIDQEKLIRFIEKNCNKSHYIPILNPW